MFPKMYRKTFEHFYPNETLNGTKIFYDWMCQYASPDNSLLNLGAGPPTRSDVRIFRAKDARITGAEIDPIVLANYELDDAHVIENSVLSFPRETFDLVFSDFF
jgi:hypothetical protein